jgi:hypothetical protein
MNQLILGSIFFLRFLNPSFVSPQNFNLYNRIPNSNSRRTLIIISKIIQNLANGVTLNADNFKKESYLITFFDIMNKNRNALFDFLSKISSFKYFLQFNNIKDVDLNKNDDIENLKKNKIVDIKNNYKLNLNDDNTILRSLLTLQHFFISNEHKQSDLNPDYKNYTDLLNALKTNE